MRVVKNLCDVCGKEIPGKRIRIGFGDGSWDDENQMDLNKVMDICETCHATIIQLLAPNSKKATVAEETVKEKMVKKSADIDKQVLDMYFVGYTWNEIASKLRITRGQVSYAITKARKKGLIPEKHKVSEQPKAQQTRTVVDEYGCVLKTEFI